MFIDWKKSGLFYVEQGVSQESYVQFCVINSLLVEVEQAGLRYNEWKVGGLFFADD